MLRDRLLDLEVNRRRCSPGSVTTSQGLTPLLGVIKLIADRPHLLDYLLTPIDYKHTDNDLRLVMTLVALSCTRHSQAPNSAVREEADGRMLSSAFSPPLAKVSGP